MAANSLLLHHISQLVAAPEPDAVLLQRFLCQGDEAAFTALVKRHGSLVHHVCRRVLADTHLAEDAFQATFLVLARRARSIRRPTSLAAWLHGVAHHMALRARRREQRRQQSETAVADLSSPDPRPDPLAEVSAREVLVILDEEVARLPEVFRLPILLCGLEGLGLEETARRLGWTRDSVKGRLERGRKRLHERLVQRGLTLTAVLAAAEIAQGSNTVGLAASATARAALAFAAGKATVSAGIAALAEEAVKGLALTRATVVMMLVLAAGMVVAGTGAMLLPGWADPPAKQTAPPVGQETAPRQPKEDFLQPTDRYGDPLPAGALARLGTSRFRLQGIRCLVYSPDGKTLASGGDSGGGPIRFWDAATGKLLRRLENEVDEYITSLTFSQDGKLLASTGLPKRGDITVRLWDAITGKQLREFGGSSETGYTTAFSLDGKLLANGGQDGTIHVWEAASGRELLRFRGQPGPIGSLVISPDGKTLAANDSNGIIRLWDTATGKVLRQLPGQKTDLLAFSPDNLTLASGNSDGPVCFWEVATGKERLQVAFPRSIILSRAGDNILFSPDGTRLAAGYPGVILDVRTGKELVRLEEHSCWHRCLAFSPDGKILAGDGLGRIRFWDTATGKEIFKDSAHREKVSSLSFFPDGKTLATASADRTVRIWDTATGKELFQFRGHGPFIPGEGNHLAVSPDGHTVAAWLGDTFFHWDIRKPGPIEEFRVPGEWFSSRVVTFTARGRMLAAVWNPQDTQGRLLGRHHGRGTAPPDGRGSFRQ